MVTLWQELDQFYDDVWENSNDYARHKKGEENDWVYMFLASLNRNMDEVRGRILGQKPLPSIHEVFSEVSHEESQRRIMSHNLEPSPSHEPKGLAHVSRGFDSEGDK